jgi:hypothetical protein
MISRNQHRGEIGVAEAGWYPDPGDPNSEAFFDGQNWTEHRRPKPLQTPAPIPPAAWQPPPAPPQQWQAPPAEQWGAPPQWETLPERPRARRRPKLIALAVALLLAAGITTWLVWPSGTTRLTYQGKKIAAAGDVLTTAEANLQALVKNRHGATNDQTRCYFTRPVSPAPGTKHSDITNRLECGPVLFVDGIPDAAYLRIALTSDDAEPEVTLTPTPTSSLTGIEPAALPTDVTLVRPDGKTPPDGAGGLQAPDPPAANKDALTVSDLRPIDTPQQLHEAKMVGKNTGVQLEAAGEVPRYGRGDEARAAPAGQTLMAFQLSYLPGALDSTGSGRASVVVSGGRPRTVPETVAADEWVVVAMPASGTAVLELRDGGYTQTLSLPDGKPGPNNLAVLTRSHRFDALRKSGSLHVHFSNGNGSADGTWLPRITAARLLFWDDYYHGVHASDGRHALLWTDLDYKDTYDGKRYGFDPQLLRLVLPDGHVIRARNIAKKNRVKNVFEVPATFTHGTIKVTGSTVVGDVTVTIEATFSVRISFVAG